MFRTTTAFVAGLLLTVSSLFFFFAAIIVIVNSMYTIERTVLLMMRTSRGPDVSRVFALILLLINNKRNYEIQIFKFLETLNYNKARYKKNKRTTITN